MKKAELVSGLRALGLEENDTVLVQGSFIPFRRIEGGPKTVIEALLEILLPHGTLIMPAFNWDDFGKHKLYSKLHSKPQTGNLTEIFAEWKGAEHIYHPIHAFTLLGANAKTLADSVSRQSSFGKESLFGKLHEMDAKIMLLGVNYRDGLTFFHYIEEMVGVPYRKFMTLKGKVEERDGTIQDFEFPYYGRLTMDIQYDINKVAPCLETSPIASFQMQKIGMATIRIMRASDTFECLKKALQTNPKLVLVD